MTRDKERLAEEVIELKRVNDDVVTRLKLAQAEVIRATGELRKRERALEALERGDDDGGAARRATRVLELEAENEVYLSEVARLASLLRLDPDTGRLPGTSAGRLDSKEQADQRTTAMEEKGAADVSDDVSEVARLRAELAFGAKHALESGIPFDPAADDENENALMRTEARAEKAEARVASLERDAAEALAARDAAAARAEASETRAAALASALEKAQEDRDHFRLLAAMEAAAAEEAAEEASIADAECARVRPELDSLRRQIADIARAADRERARAEAAEARERATLRSAADAEAAARAGTSERKEARERAREELRRAMAPPAGFAPRKALAVKNVETSDVSSRAPFVSAATVKRRLSLKAKEKEKEKPARLAKQEKTQQQTGISKPSEKAPRDSAMEPRRFGSEAPRGGSEQPSPRDEDRLAGEIV
jgi:hypothetical protein